MEKTPILQRLIGKIYTLATSKEDRLRDAAQEGNVDKIKALLEQGASIDSQPVSKMPTTTQGAPLHLAALGGHAAAVRLLLEEGANPNLTNFYGLTPLSMWYREADRMMKQQGLRQEDVDDDLMGAAIALMQHGAQMGTFRSKRSAKAVPFPNMKENTHLQSLERIVAAHVDQASMERLAPASNATVRRPRL